MLETMRIRRSGRGPRRKRRLLVLSLVAALLLHGSGIGFYGLVDALFAHIARWRQGSKTAAAAPIPEDLPDIDALPFVVTDPAEDEEIERQRARVMAMAARNARQAEPAPDALPIDSPFVSSGQQELLSAPDGAHGAADPSVAVESLVTDPVTPEPSATAEAVDPSPYDPLPTERPADPGLLAPDTPAPAVAVEPVPPVPVERQADTLVSLPGPLPDDDRLAVMEPSPTPEPDIAREETPPVLDDPAPARVDLAAVTDPTLVSPPDVRLPVDDKVSPPPPLDATRPPMETATAPTVESPARPPAPAPGQTVPTHTPSPVAVTAPRHESATASAPPSRPPRPMPTIKRIGDAPVAPDGAPRSKNDRTRATLTGDEAVMAALRAKYPDYMAACERKIREAMVAQSILDGVPYSVGVVRLRFAIEPDGKVTNIIVVHEPEGMRRERLMSERALALAAPFGALTEAMQKDPLFRKLGLVVYFQH